MVVVDYTSKKGEKKRKAVWIIEQSTKEKTESKLKQAKCPPLSFEHILKEKRRA